jgi:dipeptidyl aminopeptidase/acylaminoacyl peptidase
MKPSRLLSRLIVLSAGVMLLTGSPQAAEKKDLAYFFKNPEYAGFQLSPNGQKLAVLAPYEGRMNLVVMNTDISDGRFVTNVKSQDVSGFFWVNDERLVFVMDKDGNESFGMFAVNADGSRPRTLAEPVDEQIKAGAATKIVVTQLLDLLRDDDEHILVTNNERRAANPDVYRMNVYTGRMFLEIKNPGNVAGWVTDFDGEVIGAGFSDGAENGILMRDRESGEFREIARFRYDAPSWQPAAIKDDGRHGWVSSRITPDGQPRDKAAIYEFDFETQTMGDLVFEHDKVDVENVMMSEKTRDMVGVSYTWHKPERVYTDPRWKAMMAGIDQALPNTVNTVSSLSRDESVAVITAYSDRQPAQYYLYDTNDRALRYLGESRPWIKAEELAEMKPVTFTARDGMELQGYVTLPPGSDGKNLPTVVHPHGGPWARDGWGYNSNVQFLANRGYAVLQVNFRGSTGFGLQHYTASRKQWGRAMQSDISDMLEWAVDEGITDPERVCIFGASYGGYATMAGLTFTPELYQCGINYVGVTDLVVFQETMPTAWEDGKIVMSEMVGDIETEEEFLEEWSPSQNADKIQAPLFMAYGKKDPRVHIDNFKVMEDALKEAGKKEGRDYWTMVKKDEGHGFRKQENVYDFYGRVDSFLAQYLGN